MFVINHLKTEIMLNFILHANVVPRSKHSIFIPIHSEDGEYHLQAYFLVYEPTTCVEERDYVRSFHESSVNVQACKSRKSWLKYITKEDEKPYFNCKVSEIYFNYQARSWRANTSTFSYGDPFMLEHHNKWEFLQNMHSERISNPSNVNGVYCNEWLAALHYMLVFCFIFVILTYKICIFLFDVVTRRDFILLTHVPYCIIGNQPCKVACEFPVCLGRRQRKLDFGLKAYWTFALCQIWKLVTAWFSIGL
jgi:hypothetical protein